MTTSRRQIVPQHVFHASPEIAHQQKALPPLEADGTK
jgi:hypothetical protein